MARIPYPDDTIRASTSYGGPALPRSIYPPLESTSYDQSPWIRRKRLMSLPMLVQDDHFAGRVRRSLHLASGLEPTSMPVFSDYDRHDKENVNYKDGDLGESKVEGKSNRRGSIRQFLRRASSVVRPQRSSPSRTNNFDDISEASSMPTRWQRLRQVASFRHSRSGYDIDGASHLREASIGPIPGSGNAPPIIPHNSGAAARATAAAQNGHLGFLERRMQQLDLEDSQADRESGVGIVVTVPNHHHQVESINRVDFITALPIELAIQILSHLDHKGLATAALVSRSWNKTSNTSHVWREAFCREKSHTYATSGPIVSGAGLGLPPVQPDKPWKEIYRVRHALEANWRGGKAKPVYLNGHLDSIYCVQFDEHKIITGSRDKTIRIWDMHTYECKLVIGPPDIVHQQSIMVGEDDRPLHYAALPDTTYVAECFPKAISFPMHHNKSILCLQYDDEILVTGSSDGTCIVYDIKKGYQPIRRLQHHSAAVLDLAFDEKYIVTCSKDVTICIWDRETGAMLKQLRGHSGPVNAVQMRGNTIVSCSGDFKVKLWNIDTGKNIREFVGHTKGLACSQFSDDSRLIASAGNDKIIRIWDANTGECLRSIGAHENLVRSLHIDSISGRLISGSYDQDIKVFDMETGRLLLDFPKWHSSWVLGAKSDYRRIISTGQDPKILIMDFGIDIDGIELLESDETVGLGNLSSKVGSSLI